MDKEERRRRIMQILRRDLRTTIVSLATELDVSERTIRRDIDSLSLYEPIYTSTGRYQGGVHLLDDTTQRMVRINQEQLDVICAIVERRKDNASYIKEEELEQLMAFLAWNGEYACKK